MKAACSNANWHVLYTRPNYERMVKRQLERIGVECFLPMHFVYHQWCDRKKKMELPLFQRYIFVNIRPENRYYVFVKGVIKFVCYDGVPAILKQKEIDGIRQLIQGNPTVSNEKFIEGDTIKVVRGPMEGLEGILINKKGASRLAVQLKIMNRYILVDISSSDIDKVNCNNISSVAV